MQEAVDAVFDQMAISANVVSDDRQTRGEFLKNRIRKSFGVGRMNRELCLEQLISDVCRWRHKRDLGRDAKSIHEFRHPVSLGADPAESNVESH